MLKNEKGEFNLVALISLLFGSILFVSAAVLNSTDNSSTNMTFNNTLLNISLNESIIDNSQNITSVNETLNLTMPIENVLISNQSITSDETVNLTIPIDNLTSNESLPKKLKNLSEIVEKNKNKLNEETENYLKNIKDKKEVKDFIIKFRNSIDENKLVNVTLEKKIEKFKAIKVKGKIEDIETLIEDSEVEFLELEQNVEILGENIPLNIKKVKADSVWNLSKGSGVKVAVLDTGIGFHDDLLIAGGISFVDDNYFDSNGHGTSVAGAIAASLNNEGLVGVAPDVSLYSVKIMQGSTGDLSNAIAGIEWAINNSMDVVSMSFGFDSYSQIFKEVLQEAYNNNILLVAASGNNGQDNILYPAKYDTVIAVGAIDSNDNLASFSSYGFEQELVAPGVGINSTSLGNSYGLSSGTSLAAPHVAGAAALIKAFNNSLTNEQIRAKLRNDALDLGTAGKDDLFGYGLVQINLQTTNFTITNLSYFYEVFNITDFGLPNQSYWFWLNGTGTIDDVDFLPGYYLINITYQNESRKSNIYNVTLNGTIFILAERIGYSDDFSTEGGTFTDGIGWINENLSVRRTETGAPQVDVECFELTGSFDPPWAYCYAINSAEMTDCDNDFGSINCNGGTTCDSNNNVGVDHPIIPVSSVGTGQTIAEFYWQCGGGAGQKGGTTNNPTWYVVSKKRARCTSTTAYVVEGWYGGDNWVIYDTDSCATGTVCTDTQNFTSKSDYVNPCQLPPANQTCSGTISAIVTDSKNNALKDLKVYRNSVLNGTTDNDGSRTINFTNVVCGDSQSMTIKCADDTECDTKSTTIDSDGDYDSLSFTCNICINKTDLSIKTSDVTIKSTATNKFNITALINVDKVSANDVVVDFRGQNLKNDITQNESKTISFSQYVNQNVSVLWDLNSTDFISITIDFKNTIAEIDESNNYVKKAARPATKAYVDIATDYFVLTSVINNYLDDYIDLVSTGQDVNIYVGRKNSNIPKGKRETREYPKQKWELSNNLVSFNAKREELPYNGLIVKDGINVYVFGNEIDGDIAALRKLVDNQEFYFSKSVNERIDYISEEDLDGLFVFDYLHTDENQAKYRKNNNNFAKVVENVLNSDVSTLAIKRVLTYNDNTSLRMKHVNAELSPKFQQFSNPQPVVLARGLWSNLFTWEDFGFEIARGVGTNKPRDTWLIEITGGPNTECSTCPNYRYSDLTQYYWPALISGIQKYSNKTNLTYVGFSNGCRTALSSLELYNENGKQDAGYYNNGSDWILTNLSARPVDTFVGVGCPGAFDYDSPFKTYFKKYGQQIINKATSQGFTHFTQDETGKRLQEKCESDGNKTICYLAAQALQGSDNNGTISINLNQDYLNFIVNTSDTQHGLNIKINHTRFIYGYLTGRGRLLPFTSDGVVTYNDISDMNDGIISSDKYYPKGFPYDHGILPDANDVEDYIKKYINTG